MIIIGIDPALTNTGWGIINYSTEDNKISFVADGTIATNPKDTLQDRLKYIHENLQLIINKYHPTDCAIEESFVNTNARTSLKLGMARGAIILSFSINNISVCEYTPRAVKQTISGSGRADKNQVEAMVKILLPGCKVPHSEHSADALAIAITHIHSNAAYNRLLKNN